MKENFRYPKRTTTKKILDNSNQIAARNALLDDASALPAEQLGQVLYVSEGSKRYVKIIEPGIKVTSWLAIPIKEDKDSNKYKASLALYIARRNYEFLTANVEDILTNPSKYGNTLTVETNAINNLRKSNKLIYTTDSIPHSRNNLRLFIANILRTSFYNLYNNVTYLTKEEFLEAKDLLNKLSKLNSDIKANKYNVEKLLEIETAHNSGYNQ